MARILVGIDAAIQDGASGSELGLNHRGPFLGRVIVAVKQFSIGIISEQFHARQLILAVSATAIGSIAHARGLTAIAHEHRHGILLLGRGIGRIHVKHIVPVKRAARQGAHCDTVDLRGIAIHRWCHIRIFPVIHHLSHRGGDTARQAMLGATGGTLAIEG